MRVRLLKILNLKTDFLNFTLEMSSSNIKTDFLNFTLSGNVIQSNSANISADGVSMLLSRIILAALF